MRTIPHPGVSASMSCIEGRAKDPPCFSVILSVTAEKLPYFAYTLGGPAGPPLGLLHARDADDLAPLNRFLGLECRDRYRRARARSRPCGREQIAVGLRRQGLADQLIQLVDDRPRRAGWRINSVPRARFVAWHELGDRRKLLKTRVALEAGH